MADKLDDVQKQLIAAAKKIESISAKVTLEMDMTQGGAVVKGNGKGTLEFVRKADKHFFRMELKNNMVTKFGEQEMKMEQSTLSVSDGEFVYALVEGMGQKNCTKSRADKAEQDPDTEATLKALFEKYELKVLADGKVDGKDVFVLEGTPKGVSEIPGTAKTTFYFSKDHGFMLKMVNADAEGKPTMTVTFSDMKVGAKIYPDRFKFTVPEGVQLIDQTKQP
jgi:outer membrane lipoprotein-sorting protein